MKCNGKVTLYVTMVRICMLSIIKLLYTCTYLYLPKYVIHLFNQGQNKFVFEYFKVGSHKLLFLIPNTLQHVFKGLYIV